MGRRGGRSTGQILILTRAAMAAELVRADPAEPYGVGCGRWYASTSTSTTPKDVYTKVNHLRSILPVDVPRLILTIDDVLHDPGSFMMTDKSFSGSGSQPEASRLPVPTPRSRAFAYRQDEKLHPRQLPAAQQPAAQLLRCRIAGLVKLYPPGKRILCIPHQPCACICQFSFSHSHAALILLIHP
jgi:hypothetical protein